MLGVTVAQKISFLIEINSSVKLEKKEGGVTLEVRNGEKKKGKQVKSPYQWPHVRIYSLHSCIWETIIRKYSVSKRIYFNQNKANMHVRR